MTPRDTGGADEDRFVGRRDLTLWTSAAGRIIAALAYRAARWGGPYPVLALTLLAGVSVALVLIAGSVEIYEAVAETDGVAGLDRPPCC